MKKENTAYIAYGKDGDNYLLNQDQFNALVRSNKRFIFISEFEVWITKDGIIKIEKYND